MHYRLLGNSGLHVSEICLGTMTFGEDWGWSASKHEAKQIIDAFLIPIVGARTLSQVVDNLRCLEVTLDSAQLQRLDDLSRIELNFLHDFLHSASVHEGVYGGCYNKIVNHLPEGEAMYLVVLVMRVTSKVGSRAVGRWLQLDGCSALRLLLLISIALMQPASASAEELNIHPRISQVQGGAEDVFANAYIMEGKLGTVVIDSLLTCSASRDLRRRIDALGKPLLAVIVTHRHPDHYGGVTQLVEGREHVPVVAVKGVDTIIRRDDAMKGERLGQPALTGPQSARSSMSSSQGASI
jgi:Metallo-beta-lactamase superfamily